jgi:hypothetical protein
VLWCAVRVTRATVYEPFLIHYRNAGVWQQPPLPSLRRPSRRSNVRSLGPSLCLWICRDERPGLVFPNLVFRFAESAGGFLALLGVNICFKVRLIFIWYVKRKFWLCQHLLMFILNYVRCVSCSLNCYLLIYKSIHVVFYASTRFPHKGA